MGFSYSSSSSCCCNKPCTSYLHLYVLWYRQYCSLYVADVCYSNIRPTVRRSIATNETGKHLIKIININNRQLLEKQERFAAKSNMATSH